jgi:hypothetical protein
VRGGGRLEQLPRDLRAGIEAHDGTDECHVRPVALRDVDRLLERAYGGVTGHPGAPREQHLEAPVHDLLVVHYEDAQALLVVGRGRDHRGMLLRRCHFL